MESHLIIYLYILLGIFILLISISLLIANIKHIYFGIAIILIFIIIIILQIGNIINVINTISNNRYYEKDLGVFFFIIGILIIGFNIYKLYQN